MTTMQDLYHPNGAGYHEAHEPYLAAVAEALTAQGYHVNDWHAEPNDPRDGFIDLNVAACAEMTDSSSPIWANDEVAVCWNEDRGWFLLTIETSHSSDGRYVYDLPIARVASPSTVAAAAAEQIGDTPNGAVDNHPDVDFPDHEFEVDDVPFELALRQYRSAT